MCLADGGTVCKHTHDYDHLSILASGIALVTVDGEQETYYGPAVITIPAGKSHEIVAVGDIVWFCIHAVDVSDPEKIDEVLIGQPMLSTT
jgi:quercetin dioxygenase-like cupin family protein